MRRVRGPAALLVVIVLLAAACTSDVDDGVAEGPIDPTLAPTQDPPIPSPSAASGSPTPASSPGGATDAPTPPPAPDPSAQPDEIATDLPDGPDPGAVDLALREVARLEAPTAMAVRAGDDRLYVAERAGRVRPVSPDGTVGDAIVDISGSTATGGERGLLGIAWSAAGDRLYLSSSDEDGSTRLEAVDVVDGVVQADSRAELLRVPQPAANHNGGNVVLGPDGNLWLGLGDGGGSDDQFDQGQRPDTLLATMLRITPTADGYEIPPDNPYADGGAGAPEVWAYGLRNPWRFSFDAATGDLWIADVGQNAAEEINRVPSDAAGLNYGWPRFEGDRPFDGQPADGPVTDPVHTYDHGRGCSITGGFVYRGAAIPELHGAYLYSDYCSGDIWALDVAPDGSVRADVDTGLDVVTPVSFGEGPDGELYVLSIEGPIYAIEEG